MDISILMDTRRVQISGGSTFIVSLPKKWAEKNGIESGTSINLLEDRAGNLVVSPRPLTQKVALKADIQVTGKESQEGIMRRLVGAYVSGTTSITVTSKDQLPVDVVRTVREFTRLVMGVEIVEERRDAIELQDLIDPADFSMRSGLKRMSYITERMIEDSMKIMTDRQESLLDDVILRDLEVDRITWLIHKEYNMLLVSPRSMEKNQMPLDQALNFLLSSRLIERVADHTVSMAILIKEGDIGTNEALIKEVQALGIKSRDIYSDSIKALFTEELSLADSVIDRAKKQRKKADALQRKLFDIPADEAVTLTQLLSSIDRIGAYGADIGKMTLNRSYASK
ncbi:MAG: phosphate uptake regulator PhoU [Candidatus Thermoplasmatota archaeon]|nr:phosphate uptake regulator PhoU [Candidatus Thermoplasmatota archaeon]